MAAQTVSTVPPATLDALRDHGVVVPDAVTDGYDEAWATLEAVSALGIDLDAVCRQLQDEGAQAFVDSFQAMLDAIDAKRAALTSA